MLRLALSKRHRGRTYVTWTRPGDSQSLVIPVRTKKMQQFGGSWLPVYAARP